MKRRQKEEEEGEEVDMLGYIQRCYETHSKARGVGIGISRREEEAEGDRQAEGGAKAGGSNPWQQRKCHGQGSVKW